MKIAIIYHSEHHGNTKKVLDAIAQEHKVTLIEAIPNQSIDLTPHDLIGFASGNYFSKLHDNVINAADQNLPQQKNVFLLYTYGAKVPKTADIEQIFKTKNATLLGAFGCKGFDTVGGFKYIGGIAKGHPTAQDLTNACNFFQELIKKN